MKENLQLGGSFTLPGTTLSLRCCGYGAMRLAGAHAWGPPADTNAAIAVLRAAVEAGVNHIDTSDGYGPGIVNGLIKQALHPYTAGLTLVTKVGARRLGPRSVVAAFSREELTDEVHNNLRDLDLHVLGIVNLRVGTPLLPEGASIAEPLMALAELQQKGLIRHLGLSSVTPAQVLEAQRITNIVCVQNLYNFAHRKDDALVSTLAEQGIAYVPFFPLGGVSPLQSSALERAATALNATPMQVALAWLLRRSPNILLIPGTSSLSHLRENVEAAALELPTSVYEELDAQGLQGNSNAGH